MVLYMQIDTAVIRDQCHGGWIPGQSSVFTAWSSCFTPGFGEYINLTRTKCLNLHIIKSMLAKVDRVTGNEKADVGASRRDVKFYPKVYKLFNECMLQMECNGFHGSKLHE